MEEPQLKKVFISYSWKDQNHQDWVIGLANRLESNGVAVTLDVWDLTEGQSKYSFMESCVQSSEIDRVLMILDKSYTDKADNNKGGVGTETQIISPEIYNDVNQEKFVPIVSEVDENGTPFLPIFLKSRIYIDMSKIDTYEANYDKLIRNIYGRPEIRRPQRGKVPEHLFEESINHSGVSNLLKSFEFKIEKQPTRINQYIQEFFDEFYENLKAYSIVKDLKGIKNYDEIGRVVYESIHEYSSLRNDYISFIDRLTKLRLDFDFDVFIRLFERLPQLTEPSGSTNGWYPHEYDNFKFFIYELFLYSISIGLKNQDYKFVENILHSSYFIKTRNHENSQPKMFTSFENPISDSLKNYYKNILNKNVFNPMADLIVTRVHSSQDKDHLCQADMLCHYISKLYHYDRWWFPLTYTYSERVIHEIFHRLASKRHFEKVKGVFGVDSLEGFKSIFFALKEKDFGKSERGYSMARIDLKHFHNLIDIESIGTLR